VYSSNRATDDKKSSKLKRIFWIRASHFKMGTALYTMPDLEVVNQLAERDFNTNIFLLRSKNSVNIQKGDSEIRTISIPIKHIPVISSLMYTIVLLFTLPIYILTLKPDFVIEEPDLSVFSLIPLSIFSRLNNIKFILDIRSVPVETVGFQGYLQNRIFAISILVAKRFFNSLTIITSSMKHDICEVYNIACEKVGVWTTGVSESLFDPQRYYMCKETIKVEEGVSEKFVVFYHGVFTATRGLNETIASIKLLRDKYPNIMLFLLGTGPSLCNLRDLIDKENLEKNVILHDSVDYVDVPRFISMADVCIVPLPNNNYWRFQCPLKLLEYLAMEKVVLITDIPAHRAVVGQNMCGVFIPSAKAEEIAESIIFAYNNQDNLEKWGKIGRKIIEDKYTWEKVSGDLEKHLILISQKSTRT